MPVIKMMTIIVLVALMAITMEEELSEASSTTSFVMEESTSMERMILNNNKKGNKSSTKFFMKESTKYEGMSCFDGLYDVPRKEKNVLWKKIKENSEIKSQKSKEEVWCGGKNRTRKEDSLSNMWVCVCTTTHSISLLISHGKWWKNRVMAITSGGGCKDPAPPKI